MTHGEIGTGLAYNWMLPKGSEVKEHRDTYELDRCQHAGVRRGRTYAAAAAVQVLRSLLLHARSTTPISSGRRKGKYWNSDVEKFLGKKHGISDAVAGVLSASDTPEQKVKKIYAYVAGTRQPHLQAAAHPAGTKGSRE